MVVNTVKVQKQNFGHGVNCRKIEFHDEKNRVSGAKIEFHPKRTKNKPDIKADI